IRLLDLGTRVAAPFAATLLADLGADVIKVELPGKGDFLRSIGPFVDGYSLFWAVENRGKKSITCDLRKAAGQALLKCLVPLADVVVENFQPGTLEGWGLGYEALAALNPGLVLTRVSVYGQTGPYRDRPGLDRNGIAAGGLLYITGYPDQPPVRPGVVIADYLTGVFHALAVVAAPSERHRPALRLARAPRRARRGDQRDRRRLVPPAHGARARGDPRATRGALRGRLLGGRHLRRPAHRGPRGHRRRGRPGRRSRAHAGGLP